MLTFNDDAYNKALTSIQCKPADVPHYRELIQSELTYINHFLNYLNKDDINQLVTEYDVQKITPKENEINQEQMRLIFNSIKRILRAQKNVLNNLYQSDPALWQQDIEALHEDYLQFMTLSHGLRIPSFIEEKFKIIQAEKIAQGLPQLGSLEAILIAPVQRLPRYGLLIKDFIKEIDKKLKDEHEDHPISVFSSKLLAFNQAIIQLNKKINEALLVLDQQMAREKLKKVTSRKRRSTRALLSLLGDINVLENEELKDAVRDFDFSDGSKTDKVAIEKALECETNKKLTPLLMNKIMEDKLIKLLKDLNRKKSRSLRSTSQLASPLFFLSQQVENQRTQGRIELKKALVASFLEYTSKGGKANDYIRVMNNELLTPLNKILIQANRQKMTQDDLLRYLQLAMADPNAFDEALPQRGDSPYLGHRARLKE
ncbi:MAG: hypothetical protein JSR17_00480 [Proteobacteria bacterium]|nr:hypothetical protein [Pseudomonadota bacterium]